MKILVYGINYYPELTGIGKYTAEMCEWLAGRGHQVTVITAMPYYPNWKVAANYSKKLWHTEKIKNVTVCRTPLYVPEKVTGMTRILHEFSFVLFSLPFWLKYLFKKQDVVISVCPPFHLGFPALIYGKLKRIPIVYHIQDLQIDAARKLNLIRNKKVLNFLEKAEAYLLKHVRKVSSISEGMKQNILKKGISSEKYINLPNWVDVDFIKPLPVSHSLRKELGFKDSDKIIMYSGNMGEKQGLETVLDAAQQLIHIPDLYFVMIGEGANKKALMHYASSNQLSNVRFFPLQPYKKLSPMLAMGDLHLVLQKKAAADLVLPSKWMTLLAAGCVAIVTAEPNTTLYSLVTQNKIGVLIEPENLDELIKAIKLSLTDNLDEIKANARNYAVNKLSIHEILANFEKDLLKLSSKND